MKGKILKFIYIVLGFVFMGLGIIGVILPVLPTTPFLLLTAFFFAKGSYKFHSWFVSTKLYKKYLSSFAESRSMTLKTKFKILIPASTMLGMAFIFAPIFYVKIFIGFMFIFKYYYFFFRIKTIKEDVAYPFIHGELEKEKEI